MFNNVQLKAKCETSRWHALGSQRETRQFQFVSLRCQRVIRDSKEIFFNLALILKFMPSLDLFTFLSRRCRRFWRLAARQANYMKFLHFSVKSPKNIFFLLPAVEVVVNDLAFIFPIARSAQQRKASKFFSTQILDENENKKKKNEIFFALFFVESVSFCFVIEHFSSVLDYHRWLKLERKKIEHWSMWKLRDFN